MWLREGGFRWETDHDTARRLQAQAERPLLIYYVAGKRELNDATSAALDDPAVQPMLDAYVRCRLFQEYEPDRRVVAQYGVERAPALIVVHADGTYHAHVGPVRAAEAAEWLRSAVPPGEQPTYNPLVPRRIVYHWHDDIDEALSRGRETGRPVLVLAYDLLSKDVLRVDELMGAGIVHRRFADFVHCRVRAVLGLGAGAADRFGLKRLPALVIVRPDGGFDVLEAPQSAEEVVLFALRSDAAAATAAAHPRDEVMPSGLDGAD